MDFFDLLWVFGPHYQTPRSGGSTGGSSGLGCLCALIILPIVALLYLWLGRPGR